ncbi:Sulfur carrier protein [Bosea sp. 62]|uniref:sulfur carrier protein ThiS n=1 Tax=unclassified Bosea (in: a-proteobacteria) TaxID=2653178 RepID=UPI00125AA05A|nr:MULTISPECIES: sulfur carrier protein ThiS [unclassified Bosea (in: a-proteobacteria)]CAD5287342.1 Sulfur carrier protein [Bosea sp. 21B]CAD5289678.1 Sulfur carrier protein [Bosea sp. 46]CAD5301092.1 Sulfur carrier protein [Bosea sp. 7B]VVT60475.1 Sulfur carrier protein [Bosea sp. EC-HK365B]VXB01708.1 Sulfur carrier protein [Bosea sp. 62]
MRIIVNGDTHEIAARVLAEALAELGYAGAVVATALNEAFVPAGARAQMVLADGDRLEILAPMQGG